MLKDKLTSKAQKVINKPMRTWQFWVIALAVPILVIDAFVQWFIVNNYLMAIASVILFVLFGVELYAQLKRHRSLMGQTFAVVLVMILLAAILIEYLPW
jgi:Ca2+/H+ antiporter